MRHVKKDVRSFVVSDAGEAASLGQQQMCPSDIKMKDINKNLKQSEIKKMCFIFGSLSSACVRKNTREMFWTDLCEQWSACNFRGALRGQPSPRATQQAPARQSHQVIHISLILPTCPYFQIKIYASYRFILEFFHTESCFIPPWGNFLNELPPALPPPHPKVTP